jgi:hypothetical protein
VSHGVRPRGAPTDRTLPADVFVDRFVRRAHVAILGPAGTTDNGPSSHTAGVIIRLVIVSVVSAVTIAIVFLPCFGGVSGRTGAIRSGVTPAWAKTRTPSRGQPRWSRGAKLAPLAAKSRGRA